MHLHQVSARVKAGEGRSRLFRQAQGTGPDSRPGVDFGGLREKNHSVNSLAFLAAVNVVIWVGLFFYLWRLDRRIAERERER
jgi:CcmD family protein